MEFAFFCNMAKTAPSLEVIASCTNHQQNLGEDMTRRFKDIIEMSPPDWIIDMAHFDVLSVFFCSIYSPDSWENVRR